MLSWPTKLPPSSIGESMPKFNPESGPRSDGGGVPDRGNPSPKPLPDYAPNTLRELNYYKIQVINKADMKIFIHENCVMSDSNHSKVPIHLVC
ncbi:hypothetical protein Hanom_Chr09g00762881 [Helianthus anomalus]